MNETPPILTIDEACQALRWSRATLYRRLKTGEIESIKRGGQRWIPQRAIDAHYAALLGDCSGARGAAGHGDQGLAETKPTKRAPTRLERAGARSADQGGQPK